MYLHRYPHIRVINLYANRLVHEDLHIPKQCLYPPEKKKTVHCFGGEISVKCFHVTTIYSLQSHGCEVL